MAKKITAFSKLSKAEKRIVVLKDALKQITMGFIKPVCGLVVNEDNILPKNVDYEMQLQPILKQAMKAGKKCTACQRGTLLLALVGRDNSFRVCDLEASGVATNGGTFNDHNRTDKRLTAIFSKQQIAMMETAFEHSFNYEYLGTDLYEKCTDFSGEPDPKKRSIEILKNAIKNGGIFKP
jgi:hypothetical protein